MKTLFKSSNEAFEAIEAIEAAKKSIELQALSVETAEASGAASISAEKSRLFYAAKVTKLKRLKKINELNDDALLLLAKHSDIENIENFASYALDKVARFAEVCADNQDTFKRGDNVTGISAFRYMLANAGRIVKTGEVTAYILQTTHVEPSTAGSQSSNSLKALTALKACECIKTGYYRINTSAFFTEALDKALPVITNRNGLMYK
jgi:hypothetical protein